MIVTEIFPPISDAALKRTGLDIHVAGSHQNAVSFYAAHGRIISFAVLVDLRFPKPAIAVWELNGGTKEERKLRAQAVRDKYGEK